MFTKVSLRYVLPFVCIFVIMKTSYICAEEVRENKVMSHDLEIELFLKDHRLKATDHMLVQCVNNEKVSCFINGSFNVLSVSSLNRELDFKIRNRISDRDNSGQNSISGGYVQYLEIVIPPNIGKPGVAVLDITYEGSLLEKPGSLDREDIGETTGIISE